MGDSACGLVHLIEAIIFWHPIYRVLGLMKFITAAVSWGTVIILVQHMPRLLRLPSTVATAEDGRQGYEAAVQARDLGEPFDVIVMDMQMPNLDGLQATAMLRSVGIVWPAFCSVSDQSDRQTATAMIFFQSR
ncbi:response regulator [Stieleria sp. ICT_E10.1]|uniref:response regulator n=1 Tax=Stieleria sedimenti TaxID=2976331 RepID=UPI00217FB6E6|nr:response regulator [Stieleria sedimenti]MCS7465502.1 response regulator [Stieleria sedimenti]